VVAAGVVLLVALAASVISNVLIWRAREHASEAQEQAEDALRRMTVYKREIDARAPRAQDEARQRRQRRRQMLAVLDRVADAAAVAVGVAVGAGAYLAGPYAAAAAGWLGGFLGALAAQGGLALRRLWPATPARGPAQA
jgi:hypothetical protein